jgi:tetratricopeptide (TPR) repeat protein/outer membrane protein OmpA-like peptidoglycan-associated protein
MEKVNIFLKPLFLTFCFLALATTAALSQQAVITAKQYEVKANAAFERRDYNTALAYYTTILKDEPNRFELFWNTAEAARLTRHFAKADTNYRKLSQLATALKYPLLDYNWAQVKKSLGNYDEAINLYSRYLTNNPQSELAEGIRKEIENIRWAKENSANKKYEVTHLDSNVNTVYMDVAPVQYGPLLYYTRSSDMPFDLSPVANVFATNFQEKALPLSINSRDGKLHTAHYAPNTEGSRLYHNVCVTDENNGNIICQLYSREKGADGTWSKAIALDTLINERGVTTTQPNVGYDNIKAKDILYFASNRAGGLGGMDIWAADIEPNGKLGKPYNVREVNTNSDEISPFFMNAQQILLFATEGREPFGGFDIFKAKRTTGGWEKPANMGYPMNSSFDDSYPSFAADMGRYYMVSNRTGGFCASTDKDCVCNDIWMQELKASLDISTLFVGLTGKEKLNGVKVELFDIDLNRVVKLDMNPDGNNYFFPLDLNHRYRLMASKTGLIGDTIEFDTKNLFEPITILSKEVNLRAGLKADIYTFDKINRKPLSATVIEIYSMDGKLLATKKTVVGNNWQWDGIQFGQSYRIVATKETYEKDEYILKTETLATMTKSEYRVELYLTPFSGLPLYLYFHNDEPDPGSREMTTDLTYDDTYIDYIALQPLYLRSVAVEERDTVMNFFSRKVATGYEKLLTFSSLLTQYLGNGYGMEIVMEGYASPLADPRYNELLTSRRISSVINHFYRYQGGLFREYIRKGQLRIKVLPYGSSRAAADVSADPRDRKKSVYGVKAMNERKVLINEINRFEFNASEVFNLNEALGMYFDADALGLKNKTKTAKGGNANKAKLRVEKDAVVTPKSVRRKGKNAENTEGVELGVKYDNPSSYSTTSRTTKTTRRAKQLYEVVFVDAYTGAIVNNSASVDLYDHSSEKLIGKAKRRKNGKGYVYSLDYNRDYLIKGNIAGYSEAQTSEIVYDTEGSALRTDTLYLQPFQGLPLSLFFDNGRPMGATETTGVTYDQTYREFAAKKYEFIKMYNKMTDAASGLDVSDNEMGLFFDAEVKGGYQRLVGFSNILKSYLARGMQLEIVIAGYASPLADSETNRKLSQRRIQSVINHFEGFSGGTLRRFIRSGQLKITIEPMGEISNYVSDDASNVSSIYSLEASRERRVVIKDIVILNSIFQK